MSHPPLHAKGFGQECIKGQPIVYKIPQQFSWNFGCVLAFRKDAWKSTLSISFIVLSVHFFSQSHVSLCVLKHSQLQLPLCTCGFRFASWVGYVKQELGGQANFCCAQLLIQTQAMFTMPCQYLQMLDYCGPAWVCMGCMQQKIMFNLLSPRKCPLLSDGFPPNFSCERGTRRLLHINCFHYASSSNHNVIMLVHVVKLLVNYIMKCHYISMHFVNCLYYL